MATDVIPILHVADADAASRWYRRLGFDVVFVHRFEPGFPAYVGIRSDGTQIHLSEHAGDARPDTLLYIWVDDVESVAREYAVTIEEQPWGREVSLRDPDGNRLRIAERHGDRSADQVLGEGSSATLCELERAMWDHSTRGDRAWMDAHLATTFTEVGWSGRTYTRSEIIDQEVGAIDAVLDEFAVRALGRDSALVRYRSTQSRGVGLRSSIWIRHDGRWLLDHHQGTPSAE